MAACEPGAVQFEPNPPRPDGGGDILPTTTGEGGGGELLAPWVCDAEVQNGTCTEYTGGAWDEDIAQQDCISGTFLLDTFCRPATLGICTFAPGLPLEQVVAYYLGSWLEESHEPDVSGNCGLDAGTWVSAL